MKKTLLIGIACCFLLNIYSTLAQQEASSYSNAMKDLIVKMDTTNSVVGNIKLANDFGRVADIASAQWQPYYYAAFCNVVAALDTEDNTKVDAICDRSAELLEKADKLSPKNSEIFCVKSMIALARIKVNMFQRGMEGLMNAQASLETAMSIDPTNPRVYFLLGQQAFNTPEAFGGSKSNALLYFEKSKGKFHRDIFLGP